MTDVEKIELEAALNTIRLLVENSAASRVSFEWKLGETPTVAFTSTTPLEYVSVEFTVPYDQGDHIDCPCWATGTFQRVEGCEDHPYDL